MPPHSTTNPVLSCVSNCCSSTFIGLFKPLYVIRTLSRESGCTENSNGMFWLISSIVAIKQLEDVINLLKETENNPLQTTRKRIEDEEKCGNSMF